MSKNFRVRTKIPSLILYSIVTKMTYTQVLRYLESFINYEKLSDYPYRKSLKLERIKGFLRLIGDPHDALRCIHVAGSKGKGSVCAFLTYILREAGYSVGLYTSPHLFDFRERIRILAPRTGNRVPGNEFEGMISRAELAALVTELKPVIERYNNNSRYGALSFFEVYTALAFVYFNRKKVDLAVLETGLGGRLDATNVVSPLVCVLTPISYEHTQKLGNTLKKIAAEKAGIIKERLPAGGQPRLQMPKLIVVCAPQKKEALEVIRRRCKDVKAKLYIACKDINYKVRCSALMVQGVLSRYDNLRIRLLGKHQFDNAAVAIGAIEALCNYNIKVTAESIREGIYNTVWPGRCEIVAREPLVVLDGAQNAASAGVLKKSIKEYFEHRRLIAVLGISSDKDIAGICRQLCPIADQIILTQADNPRAADVDDIEKIIGPQNDLMKTYNVKDALALAERIAKKEDLVLITGSLFVVAEARQRFKKYAKNKFN